MSIGSTIPRPVHAPSAAALELARQHMIQHRWADAATLLSTIPHREVNGEFQLNLCRNLAALRLHRPAVYDQLMTPASPSRYSISVSASGNPTVTYIDDDGRSCSLSPGDHPVAALSSIFAKIKEPYQQGKPIAIHGFGDGYLIKSCSLNPPKLIFGMEQNIYILEPDPQAIFTCLMIHDYTGSTGAIEQQRFHWFIGDNYIDTARQCLMHDLYNQVPVAEVSQSPNSRAIGQSLKKLLDDIYQQFESHKAVVDAYCAKLTKAHFADIFSDHPSRPPRAMLLTTRNSSVLQYSNADTADGLRELGWDVRVLIEPAARNTVTGQKVMQELAEFQPDMVFQIDHLRSEWVDIFPPQLPFICWIQDHLENLTNSEAGKLIHPRDFLLCGMPLMYRDRFCYPVRQFLQMPKLTKIPQRPAQWNNSDIDLMYVSSASQNPQQRAAQLAAEEKPGSSLQKLIQLCSAKMIDHYSNGNSLPSIGSISDLLQTCELELGTSIENTSGRQFLAEKLFDRLNNALYRQQAIGWAQQIAEKHNLKFTLYGPAWDKHADFSALARGPIAYGRDLENASRQAKINLVLEPTLNISHQRLLDALVAGGFCLVREHPSNSLFQQFANFLIDHHFTDKEAVESVRIQLDDSADLNHFDQLVQQMMPYGTMGDPVAHINMMIQSQVLVHRPEALPDLQSISFKNADELEQLILSFLNSPEKRKTIAGQQRIDVESRFSYASGMKRMITWMRQLIATETH